MIKLFTAFAMLFALLVYVPAFAASATATTDANASAGAIASPVINQGAASSLSLTQTGTPVDNSVGRQFADSVILTLPSAIPWFGPFTPSWTSGIDFGGKEVFTKAELLKMGTVYSATVNEDWLKEVSFKFEEIRLFVLEPIAKDGKLYAPKVRVNGDGEVAGYIDGVATSKSTTIRKLLIEGMLKALEGGANCLVVYNYGNLFEVQAWSVGLSGGGSISQLAGVDKQWGLNGSVMGGTFYGKSKANAEPWFNAVALRLGKIANKPIVQDAQVKTPEAARKTNQELAKEKDFGNIPTGTYNPATMKK